MNKHWALRAIAGAIVLALVLVGCGSGGGKGGSGGGSLSTTTRFAAMEDVRRQLETLPGTDFAADNQAIVAYIHAKRPEFVDAGVSHDNAWARFADGRLFLIINNRLPQSGSAAIAPAAKSMLRIASAAKGVSRAAAPALPKSLRVRLINALGPAYVSATSDVRRLVSSRGYSEAIGASATLEGLKQVATDGVFFMDCHGGWGSNKAGDKAVYCLASASPTSPSADEALKVDWDNNRLAYMTVIDDYKALVFKQYKTYYGFTNSFVQEYMSFGENSLVFISGCHSTNPGGILMQQAFRDKGAGVYIGYSSSVTDAFANRTARYVFDRLLGANDTDPKEDPTQRAFDYDLIKQDMQSQGLDREYDPKIKVTNELLFVPGSKGEFGVLAPSVAYMDVDEIKKELTITGIFGKDMGKVTLGSKELTVKTWKPTSIVCDLPAGLAGDLTVEVRLHKSNVVQLSEWKARFNTRYLSIGNAPLIVTGFLDVSFRADVHSHRDKPHEKPSDRVISFNEEETSNGQFTASGVKVFPGTPVSTITWAGTSNLVPFYLRGATQNAVTCFGSIDVEQKKIIITILGSSSQGLTSTEAPNGTGPDPLSVSTGILDGDSELHLSLNDDFSIDGGEREGAINGLSFHMDWKTIKLTSPPDAQAARSAATRRSR